MKGLLARIGGLFKQDGEDLVIPPVLRQLDVRISADLFDAVRAHVEDDRRGEEAGFLLCSVSRLEHRDNLLAREWIPVPDRAIERNTHGSVLSWSAAFNSEVVQRALEADMTAVLVHSHGGSPSVRFSKDDREKERALFGTVSRLLDPLPTGTLLLGRGDAVGSFWQGGENSLSFRRLVVVGSPIETWYPSGSEPDRDSRERLDRQNVAIGPETDAKLAQSTIAIIGLSGGGSHVVQQLAHQGVGGLIVVDDESVDRTNLGRLVGATSADVCKTSKVDLAERVATSIDPEMRITKVAARFPSQEGIDALRDADVVVSCVDRFIAREAINAFCRRYLIPLVDVGMAIESSVERLIAADGQVILVLPSTPCLRCWFVTDAVLEQEREERPPGYDRNPDAPGDPQVVSMNGVLASEACNVVLDLITGYSGGKRAGVFWQYEGRKGYLEPSEIPSFRSNCPACAEAGMGDPTTPGFDIEVSGPKVPIEQWSVERPFDSSEYLRRRGPWPKWTPPS